MRRIILLIAIIASNIAITFAQDANSFDSYISKFEEMDTGSISSSNIGNPDQISQDLVKLFIPNMQNYDYNNDDGLMFRYGKKISKKDFIIAFMSSDVAMPSGNYPYGDRIITVYSPSGEIIDSKAICRGGDTFDYNLQGSPEPFKINIEQANIPHSDINRNPQSCDIITSEVVITKDGRIEQTVISKEKGSIIIDKDDYRKRDIVKDRNTSLFSKYISNFKDVHTNSVRSEYLWGWNLIEDEFVNLFIPDKQNCQFINEECVWFRYGSKIERKDHTIAFIYKDSPISSYFGDYPYGEVYIVVYSPKGEIIDSKAICRGGEPWAFNIEGSIEPFKLIVDQASIYNEDVEKLDSYPYPCRITTSEFVVTKEGRIEQTETFEGSGTVVWDEKNNRRDVVKTSRAEMFKSYISMFKQVETDSLGNGNFRPNTWINKELVNLFIMNERDCECAGMDRMEGLSYRSAFKIDNKDFIVAFIKSDCGEYIGPSAPHRDNILMVYTPTGEIIDSKVISRDGIIWKSNHKGITYPFKLIVEQTNLPKEEWKYSKVENHIEGITTSEVIITKDGKIEQTVISPNELYPYGINDVIIIEDSVANNIDKE